MSRGRNSKDKKYLIAFIVLLYNLPIQGRTTAVPIINQHSKLIFSQKPAHNFVKLSFFNCESDRHSLLYQRDTHHNLNDELDQVIDQTIKPNPKNEDEPETKDQISYSKVDSQQEDICLNE